MYTHIYAYTHTYSDSTDPAQTSPNVASDQGQRCLPTKIPTQ